MVAAVADPIFAEGLYTEEQAARLARLSPRVLRRWLNGEGEHEPAILRRIPKNDAGVVGFLDLIQALAVRAIRKERKVSLQKIRDTILIAGELGVQYPFARKHQTYLFSDDVVIAIDGEQIIGATGQYKRQHLLRPVIEVYMTDLGFDPSTGLAKAYTPLRDDTRQIVITPTLHYGAPVVMPCGFTVGSLLDAVEGEGSISAAAEAYGVNEADVEFALKYDDLLAGTAK